MLNNYFKIILRNLYKNKTYTFLLAGGLSIGMAACLSIVQYIQKELSYDSFHQNSEHIYRLNVGNLNSGGRSAVTSGAMAPAFAPDFPEIENFVRFRHFPSLVQQGDLQFYEDQFFYTDSTLFEVFDFELVNGQAATVLAEPYSVILTEAAAKKYFGAENPIGQNLEIDNQFNFKVTGVIKEAPSNTHFNFDFLASIASLRQHPNESVRNWQLNSWYSHYYHTYLLLNEKADANALGQKIERIAKEYSNPENYELYGREMGLYLQPLTSIHLNPIHGEIVAQGQMRNVWILGIVAFFILLIVCSNYANLATAFAMKRSTELGVRKVMGAGKRQLIALFFNESFLISGLSLIVALALAQLLSSFLGFDFSLTWEVFLVAFLMLIFTGSLGGLYPAFIGATFHPVSIFRKAERKLGGLPVIRSLVVFQFVITFILIVATIVVFQQMNFMKEQPLGMNMEQVLVLPTRGNPQVTRQFEAFENELKKSPEIINTTISELIPGNQVFGFVCQFEGMENGENFPSNPIGFDYFETYGIEMAAGRSFSRDISTDTLERAIINETLAKQLGWQDPQEAIGKRFDFANDGENVGKVIGVAKDFHFRSLEFDIQPMLFLMDDHFYNQISLRLSSSNFTKTLAKVENTWKDFFPELPFEYFFADEHFGQQYASNQQMAKLYFYFVSLAIILACMGLFGLSMLAAQQRIKEIGIRKVLGASVFKITTLLSSDFLKLVLVALIVASPIAWYAMQSWLENFAYRMDLQWTPFFLAGILGLGIAFLTVSFQSIKAAMTNPVNSLRDQ